MKYGVLLKTIQNLLKLKINNETQQYYRFLKSDSERSLLQRAERARSHGSRKNHPFSRMKRLIRYSSLERSWVISSV
jgi:hypothetical protein